MTGETKSLVQSPWSEQFLVLSSATSWTPHPIPSMARAGAKPLGECSSCISPFPAAPHQQMVVEGKMIDILC